MSSRELNGKEETKTNTRDFLAGALIGAVVGAATALLLTPKSGRDIRSTISGQTNTILNKTDQIKEKAISKGNELASVAKEKAGSVVQTVSHQSNELINKVKGNSVAEEGQDLLNGEDGISIHMTNSDEIQRKLEETQRAFDETEQKLNQ